MSLSLLLILPLQAKAALTDNLVSYWALEDATDEHSTNDLTNNNSATFATGQINNGVDLESSSSQYLSIVDGSQTGLDITSGQLTASFWVKLESQPSNSNFALFAKSGVGASSYTFYYKDTGGTKSGVVLIYDSGAPTTNINHNIVGLTLTTGVWTHLVVQYDGSGSIAYVYKNGTLVDSDTNGSANDINNSTQSFRIGTEISEYTDGVIDEFGIWDRILTTDEIDELYAAGAGLAYPFTGGGGGEEATSTTATSTDDQTAFGLSIIIVMICAGMTFALFNKMS